MPFSQYVASLISGAPVTPPETLTVPPESQSGFFSSKNIFWEQIKKLREYTDSGADRFSEKHQGSTGWEYEMMMVYVDGKFYYSQITTSKDYNQVSSQHQIQMQGNFDEKTKVLTDTVSIDDKEVGKILYRSEKEITDRNNKIKENKFTLGFACHFHSHPQVQLAGRDKRIYTFFSPTDINSLLSSRTPLMGLVTDRVWLLVKPSTNNFAPSQPELQEVTRVEANEPEKLEQAAADLMKKYGWTLYVAKFGGTFKRLT